MPDWTGPVWLTCLGDLVDQYIDDVQALNNDDLMDESFRIEVTSPPSKFNDRDWRMYRRCVRQEMHRRGLKTPPRPSL